MCALLFVLWSHVNQFSTFCYPFSSKAARFCIYQFRHVSLVAALAFVLAPAVQFHTTCFLCSTPRRGPRLGHDGSDEAVAFLERLEESRGVEAVGSVLQGMKLIYCIYLSFCFGEEGVRFQ